MKLELRVNEDSGTFRVMFTTPCCGATHYKFEGEVQRCHLCGKVYTEEATLPVERNLDHCRFQRVSRYVS